MRSCCGNSQRRGMKRRSQNSSAGMDGSCGASVGVDCARREDAEDAFQAAFLILAVKAHAIRSAEALPAWLHRTACRAANRVASASPVEQSHDHPTDNLDAFAEVTRREAATAIDEELVRLPERYRNAVVLFHLEGLERRDVAERLGMSEPSVKALLSRGRALLRTRLARRGLALPMLLPLTLDPLPAAAIESTCRLALSLTRAGLRPWDLATLQSKSLRPMTAFLSNKFVAATFVGAACLTLVFATRGDANANADGQNTDAAPNTAFEAGDKLEPTLLALAEAAAIEATGPNGSPSPAPSAGVQDTELTSPQIISQSPRETTIREALEKDADLQFPNTPLRQALQFLADVHKINIIIDEQALEEEGLTVDDNVDIVLSGITLRSALDILLDRYDLTYVIEDEVMKITSQAAAERRVSTQAFDVSSLIEGGGSADEVAMVVEQLLVETQRPRSAGQDAKANETLPRPRVIPYHDRLIVKASGADLKEIGEILDLLWIGGNTKPTRAAASVHADGRTAGRLGDESLKIYSLENAVASEAAKVLESALPVSQGDQPLRIAVDERTNSLVVSGSENQLKIAEALLLRLDESDDGERCRVTGRATIRGHVG